MRQLTLKKTWMPNEGIIIVFFFRWKKNHGDNLKVSDY